MRLFRLLDLLGSIGVQKPRTFHEVAMRVEEDYNWVRRHVRELEEAGFVRQDGRTIDNRSGRPALAWTLTARGRRVLKAWRSA
ncbi:MAG: helix-turn-helix domain-containing protein [bacterium]